MKRISIILAYILVIMISCTKSKEVHPEIGDGNDEIVTVGIDEVHVKYIRNDIANLKKVVFHYSITDAQQFDAAKMTKTSDCFTLTLNNLQSDTLYSYYYELFPYSGNTSTTNQKTFRTQSSDTPAPPTPPTPPSDVPEGAINGLFTINENGDQVYFSQGNLQYIGSANTPYWKFTENQWDYLGDNGQGSTSQNVDRDLFGWGTSGFNHGAICYQPWSTSYYNEDYYAYGDYQYNLNDQTGQADWGYNPISNGGDQPNQWRTLTKDEWVYVFKIRRTTSGIIYAKAQVNGINGVIVMPDDWSSSYHSLSNTNNDEASFSSNIISQSDWNTNLEANGAVFLPAAGSRGGTDVVPVGSEGHYWSATHTVLGFAYIVDFRDSDLDQASGHLRDFGYSVRLVCAAQ